MKIIISPAKKMNIREDELEWANLPCFLSRAEELKRYIQGLDLDQARKLWQCNEKIALLNYGRFKEMDLERRLTPALLSYEGIQYQYMAPGVFEQGQWDYVQEHLRILSGFYGILKPLDGIVPYRLEMHRLFMLSAVSIAFSRLQVSMMEKIVTAFRIRRITPPSETSRPMHRCASDTTWNWAWNFGTNRSAMLSTSERAGMSLPNR